MRTTAHPLGVSAGQWVHSSQSMVSLHRCAHSSGVAVVFRVPPTTAAPRKSVWLRTVEALDPALISSSSCRGGGGGGVIHVCLMVVVGW